MLHRNMAALASMGLLFCTGTFPAHAEKVTTLGGYSPAQIKSACDAAGGSFAGGEGIYSCTKYNCDGKGGNCSVDCQTTANGGSQCQGVTPGRVKAGTKFRGTAGVAAILKNGANARAGGAASAQ